MLKFIRGKGQQPTAERLKQQRELFAFRNTIHHGFPSRLTALAWDQELRLMAIGSATGALRVLGQPGVEFCGQHVGTESPIVKIIFLPNQQGRLVTLCDDNSLHLWEINGSSLEEVKSCPWEGKLKKISAWCLESSGEHLILGAEGGNIYFLNLNTFSLTDNIIYQDVVMQNVPEDYKVNPGAVEALSEQPGDPEKLLIGYNRGLIVLWNRADEGKIEKTYTNTQQLESVSWNQTGTKFISAHNDGSYTIWDAACGTAPAAEPISVYGPYPCKAITKLLWSEIDGENLILFSGGLPRSNCSERQSVTAIQGKKHAAFDFTSKIIDFFTIDPKDPDEKEKGPEALVVLAEEELVVIDLLSPDWLTMKLPYLNSLHASPVICSQHVSNIPVEMWEKLKEAGEKQVAGQYSDRKWPIDGGNLLEEVAEIRDILLTGHEDGSVRVWAAGGVAMYPLYKLSTAHLFIQDDELEMSGACDDDEDNEWPPFRKVCIYDPCSDDPRLALKKVLLCPVTGTLVVAGTAGHVVVTQLNLEPKEKKLDSTLMNIVLDRDGFVWKGHKKLSVQSEPVKLEGGYQPTAILQLHPPAAVTALVLQAEWGLLAAGTAHGLALFDYVRHKPVVTKCTLNPNDLSGAGEQGISRRKSFKKSLRESFRRLRKGRSARPGEKRPAPTGPTNAISPNPRERRRELGDSVASPTITQPEAKPVERQIEARPVDSAQGSMVRCLYLARTYIISVQNTTPTLWAGTNNGTAYVFTINVPSGNKRESEDVTCLLAKEIQLKHRAPVLGIGIVDGANIPLNEVTERSSESGGPHKVIIASEEQFKIFTLPGLKPFCKFKLTAHEGSRVRRMGFALFRSSQASDPAHSEWCLTFLTNLGDCIVLSVPDLRRQLNAAVIRPDDINGISGLCFTMYGEGFYPHSSSELQRVTLSASRITQARCKVDLPPSARPVKEEEEEEEESTEEEEEEDEEEEHNVTIVSPEEVQNSSEDKKEEAEKNGPHTEEPKSVSPAPVPAARNRSSSPMVNGDSESADKKAESPSNGVEPKENGITSEEERLELSMGDITIDSVKDHLINCSATEETRVVTEKVEVKTSSTETSSETQTVVVKTSSTIINSSENSVSPPTLVEN